MSLPDDQMAQLLADLTKQVIRPREQLRCTICNEPLDECHADLMTHPLCDPVPQLGPEPPATTDLLGPALTAWDASRPRSQQLTVGPSQIAVPCDRRLAYALHGTEPVNTGGVPWAPLVGTAVHQVIAEALLAENQRLGRERWLVEQRVHPDQSISGSCDAYDTDTDTVHDWKVVGKTALESYAKRGPGQQYAGQIHLYGRGWQRAGRHPKWVRIVFLPRASASFDATYEWTAPYSRQVADAALERMYALIGLLGSLNVTDFPDMWEAVPAQPDRLCNYCPYLRRGAPADDTGCPGDVESHQIRLAKLTDGLIPA
jgi:hypothetical protein